MIQFVFATAAPTIIPPENTSWKRCLFATINTWTVFACSALLFLINPYHQKEGTLILPIIFDPHGYFPLSQQSVKDVAVETQPNNER